MGDKNLRGHGDDDAVASVSKMSDYILLAYASSSHHLCCPYCHCRRYRFVSVFLSPTFLICVFLVVDALDLVLSLTYDK